MTGTRRLACFAVVLCAALAVGSGAVGATELDCRADGPTVVGDVGGEWTADDQTLYEGSTFDLAYCNGETAYRSDWLETEAIDDDDGFAVERASDEYGDAVVYTVTVTGNGQREISFAEYVNLDADEAGGLTVEVATTDADADPLERIDEDSVDEYRSARTSLADATAALENATTEIENGDADPDAAETELQRLDSTYGNMTDRENAITEYLLERTGDSGGSMAALAAVRTNATAQRTAADAAVEQYRKAVTAERSEAKSTVRTATFGSLAAGLAVGVAAGVAVPLVAARRVEEAIKLSRNVSYDRKTALLPMLVGLLLAIIGAVVLAVVVEPSLLEVIR
ncbi:hypothetical protein A6E15_17095 [Natrinema saccharevitans]|uniref:Uncharacterized protein n=1 Tax=Natrinema saccharevitans TaxID=301967 RepID=A0A1S8B171_9EURY|nr:hypothetical protein [Natrinema saccharevitans]OLZ42571.1 hypothetical protein A6E15_17095 [Natrinema saccharevitans]